MSIEISVMYTKDSFTLAFLQHYKEIGIIHVDSSVIIEDIIKMVDEIAINPALKMIEKNRMLTEIKKIYTHYDKRCFIFKEFSTYKAKGIIPCYFSVRFK